MIDNKQRAALKVSLFPIVLLIGLILGIGYFLLQGEITLPKLNRGPTIQRIEGFPTVIYSDREMEKERRVIRSEEELSEFLNYVDETGLLDVEEKINFDKNVVIAVSTDTKEEVGHRIKIDEVYEDKEENEILIQFNEIKPGDTCEPEYDRNIAVDMVILSNTDMEIDFEKITKVVECEDKDEDGDNNEGESTDDTDGVSQEEISENLDTK
jgi:hypothetical protein